MSKVYSKISGNEINKITHSSMKVSCRVSQSPMGEAKHKATLSLNLHPSAYITIPLAVYMLCISAIIEICHKPTQALPRECSETGKP